MITLCPARAEDAPLLARTRQKAWAATYRGIYPDEWIDAFDLARHTEKDRRRIENPENRVYLAMDGDDCVGYAYFGPLTRGQYKDFQICLNSLYFLPGYQGKGLGRRVLALLTAECRRRGFDKFFCGCNAHNLNARALYEHMGGVLGAQSVGHENQAEDQVYYEFSLNPAPPN